MHQLLRSIRAAIPAHTSANVPDRELLDRFVRGRDEASFAMLVGRYGEGVWATCRRCVDLEQDAEDTFQAVFVTLARKAGSIRDRPQESFSVVTAEVKKVDARANTLTVTSEEGDSTYTVAHADKIIIADKAGKLAELKEGMEVDLWSRGEVKVVGGRGRFVRTSLTITARQPPP